MIKLADLAQALGVSTATVSNALTGKGRMKAVTRQHIQETARAMGYVMQQPAKSASDQVIIIAEANEVSFSSDIICGITAAARQAGTNCVIYDLNILKTGIGRDARPDHLRPLIEDCLNHYPVQPACVIYVAQYPRPLPGLLDGLPCPAVEVFCDKTGAQASINYDNQQGAYIAVSHLIEMGCKKIAMISGPVDSHAVNNRMIGYQRALIDHGLSFHPKLVWIGNWELDSGRELARDLLESNNRPDAIFTQNDTMAFGVLYAAYQLNLRVPEDLAVVGFDNTMFAACTYPALTSVAPPFREMGKAAFEMSSQLMSGHHPDPSSLVIPCSLSIRASSQRMRQ